MTLVPTSLRKIEAIRRESAVSHPTSTHLLPSAPTDKALHAVPAEELLCSHFQPVPLPVRVALSSSLTQGYCYSTSPIFDVWPSTGVFPLAWLPTQRRSQSSYSGHTAPQNLAPHQLSDLISCVSLLAHITHTPWLPCWSSNLRTFFLLCLEALLLHLLGFSLIYFKSLLESHFPGESSLTTLVRTTKSVSPTSVLLILPTLSYILLFFFFFLLIIYLLM